MTTILIAIAAAGLGAANGLLTRRLLAPLSYRLEEEQHLPHPGSRSWLMVASAIAVGSISAWLLHTDNLPLAAVILPLTLTAPALAAIDLDVMRLPNRILGPVALLTLAGLAGSAAWRGDWTIAVQSGAGALLAGGTFWLLHLATRGGVGFGDVKLAGVVGLVAGAVSLGTTWCALAFGSAGALIWAKLRRQKDPLPYGPPLLAGTLVVVILSGPSPG
jgi:leader peptidase (prepilin peptidase)/N-methyltransferase